MNNNRRNPGKASPRTAAGSGSGMSGAPRGTAPARSGGRAPVGGSGNAPAVRERSGAAAAKSKPKSAKHPQKQQLTPEQIEINKANRKRELYHLKRKRAERRRVFAARLALFAGLVVLIGTLSFGLFFISLNKADSDNSARYSYTIGDNKYKLDYGKAVREGRVYVSFSDIAELCGMAVMGSPEDMSFVVKGEQGNETIRFIADSRGAFVNGILGSFAREQEQA